MGALIGGATAADIEALYEYGILIGLAFQIQDDLLDTFGDEETFGKAIGGDIMTNKKTYLLISALERGDTQQRRDLAQWMSLKDPIREEKIAGVRALFEQTGARKATEEKIEQLFSQAMSKLREMEIPAEGKRAFIDNAQKLFKRKK
jgi:geranylgeranyl diphosphate synthase type II